MNARLAIIVLLLSFTAAAQAAPAVIVKCTTPSLVLEVTEENGQFTVLQSAKGQAPTKSHSADVSEIDDVDGLDSLNTIKSKFPDVPAKQITNALVTYVPNDVSTDRSLTIVDYRDADGKTLVKTVVRGAGEALARCAK